MPDLKSWKIIGGERESIEGEFNIILNVSTTVESI